MVLDGASVIRNGRNGRRRTVAPVNRGHDSDLATGLEPFLHHLRVSPRKAPPKPSHSVWGDSVVVVAMLVAPQNIGPHFRVVPRSLRSAGTLALKLRRPHTLR